MLIKKNAGDIQVKIMDSMFNQLLTNVMSPLLGGDLDSVYTRFILAILLVFTVYIICRFVLTALMHKFFKANAKIHGMTFLSK